MAPYAVPVASYPADAGSPDRLEQALGTAMEKHGIPDVVVYNAAIIRADRPGDLSVEELAESWSVNVSGVLVAALATIPPMLERGGGTFLVTGGMPPSSESGTSTPDRAWDARGSTASQAENRAFL